MQNYIQDLLGKAHHTFLQGSYRNDTAISEEIAGYPHYENVCSNLLKFFLDPNARPAPVERG